MHGARPYKQRPDREANERALATESALGGVGVSGAITSTSAARRRFARPLAVAAEKDRLFESGTAIGQARRDARQRKLRLDASIVRDQAVQLGRYSRAVREKPTTYE